MGEMSIVQYIMIVMICGCYGYATVTLWLRYGYAMVMLRLDLCYQLQF